MRGPVISLFAVGKAPGDTGQPLQAPSRFRAARRRLGRLPLILITDIAYFACRVNGWAARFFKGHVV